VHLARQGCHNINLVTPSHVVAQILEALPLAVEEDLRQTLAFELDRYTPFRPEQVYFAILSSADLLADIQPAQARLLLGELLKVRPGEYEVLVLHAYLEWRGKRAAAAKSLLAQAVASSSRRYLRPARCRQRLAAMKRDKRLAAAAAAAMSSLGTTPDDMSHFRSVVGLAALAPLVERLASACRETNNNTLAKFSGKTLK